MTAHADMTAAGLRILDLLTVPEAALRLDCSPDTVLRLAGAGELDRERFGALVRITPESVAAYEQRMIAEAQAAKAS
jgi:excisionase family DNA binding protein